MPKVAPCFIISPDCRDLYFDKFERRKLNQHQLTIFLNGLTLHQHATIFDK